MTGKRTLTEEGQVTPALLLAVIGGFALAVAFVSLQFLSDQTGRAATASDAAALAVGAEHKTELETLLGGGGQNSLDALQNVLQQGPALRVDEVARQYAAANGAELARPVVYNGFDLGKRQWEYTVTTRQRDKVKGGTSTAQSESTSHVAVQITSGLCTDPVGLVVNGTCAALPDLLKVCDLSLDPPADPKPGDKPPDGLDGVGCVDPSSVLGWNIHLVN